MAQKWREVRSAPPLDAKALERLALRYVERFATTRAKMRDYLVRKLRERGWSEESPADVAGLVERLADLGYIDDRAFAGARAASLMRRGYGPRRVAAALKLAGVAEEQPESEEQERWEAALVLARRKRIGPFAEIAPDRAGREKALATLLRAGHDMVIARRIVAAQPGIIPSWDDG